MPNQKSPIIFLACGIAALFLLLAGLRHEASKPLQEPVEAQSADEIDDTGSGSPGSTRITHIAKVEAPPVAKNRKPPPEFLAEKKEDFDAEQRRASGDSYITGSVRNEKNKGLGGARVQLYNNDPNTTNPPLRESVADQDGSFTLAQLNDGDRNYILVSRAEGYAPEARYVTLSGTPAEISVGLVPAVTLTGKVINAVTSEPLAGASIVHPSETDEVFGLLGSITSGPGGTFTFEDCHPGRVVTRASTPGYRTATVRLRAPTTTATVMLVPGGSKIRGFTLDRLTSKPQSGARVWLESENNGTGLRFRDSKLVNDDGSFEFADLPGSTYRIYAIRGMKSPAQEIELADNEVKEGVAITLPADLFVSGKVVDANENKALPGVRIWYKSPRGKSSVLSDKTGLFAFDTMAIERYTIQVHEKGYLPVQEKKTTGVVETLTRPVPRNASSDSFVLRLRAVPAINGNVVATRRPETPPTPVSNADVSVDYLMGEDHEKITTKSDPNGDFFINLPERRRGEAKIVAFKNNAIDAVTQKIPTRKTVKLNLKRNMAFGTLLLSDRSPLDGIRMEIAQFLPDNKENALILHERDIYTGIGGRFWFPLPEKQKVQLTFFLPDNVQIPKTYQTDNIINKRINFIYDPVANDVLLDSGGSGKGGGRGQGGQGARGAGGQGGQAGRAGNGQGGNGGGRPGGNGQGGAGQGGHRTQ